MSEGPVLEVGSATAKGVMKPAAAWLNTLGWLYVGIFVVEFLGMFWQELSDVKVWSNLPAILFDLSVVGGSAVIFVRCARGLHRGVPRGIVLAFWAVLLNLFLLLSCSGGLLWVTFSGMVDPGVPLMNLMGVVLCVAFAGVVLGPALYYLVKLMKVAKRSPFSREIRTGA